METVLDAIENTSHIIVISIITRTQDPEHLIFHYSALNMYRRGARRFDLDKFVLGSFVLLIWGWGFRILGLGRVFGDE